MDAYSDAAGDVRHRVLREARRLVLNKGFGEARTIQIARGAGTSESALIRLYNNKFGLLQAVHADCWREINETISVYMASNPDTPAKALLGIARSMWGLYDTDQRDALLMATSNCASADMLVSKQNGPGLLPKENEEYISLIGELCADLVAEGGVSQSVLPESLKEIILGTIDGVVIGWYVCDKAGKPEKKIRVDDALSGLEALLDPKPLAKPKYVRSDGSNAPFTVASSRKKRVWQKTRRLAEDCRNRSNK